MRIYVLRHGIAEDAPPGGSDADRALTEEGKQRLRKVLTCAREAGVGPSLILTSPLKRAVQTAAMAARVLEVKREPVETNTLLPSGSPQAVWSEIRRQSAGKLLLAGHEPLLGMLVAFLLRCPALRVDLKKAALVSIDIEAPIPEPRGILNWILTPKLAGR